MSEARRFHMRTSVRGALRNPATIRALAGACTDERGKIIEHPEFVKHHLLMALERGIEFLPDSRCDNWDGEQCLGHPVEVKA